MTEKLYYEDSHLNEFDAAVTGCQENKGLWLISLDKTAFFPEGGGQSADTGYIGALRVTDVHEREGEIWHYCSAPLEIGTKASCRIDWEQRYRRMQNHSGEHIVSGITHALHGYENVGFHMGAEFMTVDFDGELSPEELSEIEKRANETVRADVPIRTYYPDGAALAALQYRSKLELTENVRIVEIEGIDRCACCAPHVSRTGEVGSIKILDAMRHRGGMRLSMVCGMDALDSYRLMQDNVTAVSGLLSVKRREIAEGVSRVLQEQQRLKERSDALSMELVRMKADTFAPTEGSICVFDNMLDEAAQRELVNRLSEKSALAAVFSGNDETGYKYIMGSHRMDLRTMAKIINEGIGGRGGGKPEMIQGNATQKALLIQEFVGMLPCIDSTGKIV